MAAGPVTHTRDPSDPEELTSDLGWALYPIGFSNVLNEAWTRYGKPIQILENGIADAAQPDSLRQTFMVTHLREVWYAMNVLGVDIDGYFHWSHSARQCRHLCRDHPRWHHRHNVGATSRTLLTRVRVSARIEGLCKGLFNQPSHFHWGLRFQRVDKSGV